MAAIVPFLLNPATAQGIILALESIRGIIATIDAKDLEQVPPETRDRLLAERAMLHRDWFSLLPNTPPPPGVVDPRLEVVRPVYTIPAARTWYPLTTVPPEQIVEFRGTTPAENIFGYAKEGGYYDSMSNGLGWVPTAWRPTID